MNIKCEHCGFETNVIECDGLYQRDCSSHGNNNKELKCFNCNIDLVVPVKKEPVQPKIPKTINKASKAKGAK